MSQDGILIDVKFKRADGSIRWATIEEPADRTATITLADSDGTNRYYSPSEDVEDDHRVYVEDVRR
jgi:hypothetical protein